MRGSIYINELNGDPNHVTLSPSWSPSLLLSKENVYGFTWQKMLDALGIEHGGCESDRLLYEATGTVPDVKSRAKRLESHIGVIATYAAKHPRTEMLSTRWVPKTLGTIATQYLPSLADDYPFKRMIGQITHPIAEETNDDGVSIIYDTTRRAAHKKSEIERLLQRYSVNQLKVLDPSLHPQIGSDELNELIRVCESENPREAYMTFIKSIQ